MAANAPQPPDRRVQRTRRALRDALLSLLPESGWDDISVQDLCERADVGRSTFYLHFQNKEELLVGGLSDLRSMLRAQAITVGDARPGVLTFVRGLIDHVDEQRKLFRSIVGRRSGHTVQIRFREMVMRLVAEEIALHAAGGWQRDAGARYVGGALVELLAWWVDASKARSADDIERYFHQLTAPVIAQLDRSTG